MPRVSGCPRLVIVVTNQIPIRAAKAGMKALRRGAGAVEAVEAAIVAFENSLLTNAGYGSNLTKRGEVECDATIVDYYGRSGAVGAAPSTSAQTFP